MITITTIITTRRMMIRVNDDDTNKRNRRKHQLESHRQAVHIINMIMIMIINSTDMIVIRMKRGMMRVNDLIDMTDETKDMLVITNIILITKTVMMIITITKVDIIMMRVILSSIVIMAVVVTDVMQSLIVTMTIAIIVTVDK